MLTGNPPHVGAREDVLKRHLEADIALPPNVLGSLPSGVDSFLRKCLERSSTKRFMTLNQLVTEMEGILKESEEPAAASVGEGAKARKNKELSKTMLGGFGALTSEQLLAVAQAEEKGASDADSDEAAPALDPADSAAQTAVMAKVAVHQSRPEDVADEAEPASDDAMKVSAQQAEPSESAKEVSAVVPSPSASSAGKGKKGTKGESRKSRKGKFRETMWFKKGELDAAAATEAAQKAATDPGVADKVDSLPMEDRYSDDGSLTAADAKFSLKTGRTQMMAAVDAAALSTRKRQKEVSAEDLLGDMKAGRGKVIAAIIAGVVVVLSLIYLAASGNKSHSETQQQDASVMPADSPSE